MGGDLHQRRRDALGRACRGANERVARLFGEARPFVRPGITAFPFRSTSQSYFDSDSVRFKRFFPHKIYKKLYYLCPIQQCVSSCSLCLSCVDFTNHSLSSLRAAELNCDYPFRLPVYLAPHQQIIATQWHGNKTYTSAVTSWARIRQLQSIDTA